MDNRKKLLIAGLIVFTLVLGGVSFFISQQLQNTQAPPISSANTTTGTTNAASLTATSDMYAAINTAFEDNTCAKLLTNDSVAFYAPVNFTDLTSLNISSIASYPDTQGTGCIVLLNGTYEVDITINLYSTTSNIGAIDSLMAQVDGDTLGTIIKSASVSNSPYSYAEVKGNATECQTNIYSNLNDFQYISLTYKNFGKSCTELNNLATQITYVVGSAANDLTKGVKEHF